MPLACFGCVQVDNIAKDMNDTMLDTYNSCSNADIVTSECDPHDVRVLHGTTELVQTKYVAGPHLGAGASGTVVGCTSIATNERFACKTIDVKRLANTRTGIKQLRQELRIMTHLSGHPNVVQIFDVHECESHLFIIQELCHGTLSKYMTRTRMSDVARLFRGVLNAVIHCHHMGVIHRDIKPDNFLMSMTATVKIADFGLATFYQHNQKLYDVVGSPYFMAPEMVRKTGYGPEVDTWACGVLLFRMLSGAVPFPGHQSEAIFAAIRTSEEVAFKNPSWLHVSNEAKDLVAKMLCKDVKKRIHLENVLNHPWIQLYYPSNSINRSVGGPNEFINAFRIGVEMPYYAILAAKNTEDVNRCCSELFAGLATIEALLSDLNIWGLMLNTNIINKTTVPILWRINIALPVLRGMKPFVDICEQHGFLNIAGWASHVLSDPSRYGDVINMDSKRYVHLLELVYSGVYDLHDQA